MVLNDGGEALAGNALAMPNAATNTVESKIRLKTLFLITIRLHFQPLARGTGRLTLTWTVFRIGFEVVEDLISDFGLLEEQSKSLW